VGKETDMVGILTPPVTPNVMIWLTESMVMTIVDHVFRGSE
jgi:hypothetical protein